MGSGHVGLATTIFLLFCLACHAVSATWMAPTEFEEVCFLFGTLGGFFCELRVQCCVQMCVAQL